MTRSAAIPIVAFLIVSAIASPALAELQGVSGLNPDVLRLTVFSTAVGAAAVWMLWRKRLAYPAATTFGWGRPLLVSIAACLAAGVVVLCLAKVEGAPWRPPGPGALGAPLAVVLAVQLLGAAAEEVGWRGLVQPLLETRLAAWKAALITGALFGLGHFYLAFAVGPVAFLLFIVGAVALSLVLALATLGRSWQSRIAIATLLHFLVNMETFFLFADGDGSVLYFTDLAVALGGGGGVALGLLLRNGATRAA